MISVYVTVCTETMFLSLVINIKKTIVSLWIGSQETQNLWSNDYSLSIYSLC